MDFGHKTRNTSVGVTSFVARLGSLLGILLVDQGLVYGNPATLSAAGLLSVASGLSVAFLLPETAARPLHANLEEEADWDRRRKEQEEEEEVEGRTADDVT